MGGTHSNIAHNVGVLYSRAILTACITYIDEQWLAASERAPTYLSIFRIVAPVSRAQCVAVWLHINFGTLAAFLKFWWEDCARYGAFGVGDPWTCIRNVVQPCGEDRLSSG
jgi:hypothetical protein